ncbi:hypothetical protein [Ornatilinea apprima]|uniref:hypothetical protein n=1 Tax=Ornatilinea apprima TaxID=1134406 RepID=UPI00128EE2B4|nr:hypothetical protein [Ornatilinea apprima]
MKENASFFIFSDNTFHSKRYTWATSIIPRSQMVNRRCHYCSAVENYPSGEFDVVLENGSEFPDMLGCGAYPFLILSERVISTLVAEKISAFHTFSVGISEIRSKSKMLMETDPPKYYRVEIDGNCQIDLEASGLELVHFCPECHHLVTNPRVPNGLQIISGSWDKSDVFRDVQFYPRINFCNESLPGIVNRNKFTNFRFEFMQGPWNSSTKGLNITKLFKQLKESR